MLKEIKQYACLGYVFLLLSGLQLLNAQPGNILFVDDDGGDSYQTEYLSRLIKYNLRYSSWSIQMSGIPNSDLLKEYNIVIWETGWGSLNSSRESILQSYLDAGGKLFISGQGIVQYDNSFRNNYLHAKYYSSYCEQTPMKGNDAHPISINLNFEVPLCVNLVSVSTDAVPLFYVSGSTFQSVGLCYEGIYKVVLLNFNFGYYYYYVPTQTKDEILYRAMKWLGYYRIKISGTVRDTNGNSMDNVKLKLNGNSLGSVTANNNGYYEFRELQDGYYTIIPEKEGYKFTPREKSLSFLTGEISSQDFVGEKVESVEFKIVNNLFNPRKSQSVKITYDIPTTSKGSLKIYTVNGELIKTLLDGEILAGGYEFLWNGTNDSNEEVASGLYLIHLQGTSLNEIKKIILVK